MQSALLDARIIRYVQPKDIVMIVKKAFMAKGAMKNVILAVLKTTVCNQMANVIHVRKVSGELLALIHAPIVLSVTKKVVNAHRAKKRFGV